MRTCERCDRRPADYGWRLCSDCKGDARVLAAAGYPFNEKIEWPNGPEPIPPSRRLSAEDAQRILDDFDELIKGKAIKMFLSELELD